MTQRRWGLAGAAVLLAVGAARPGPASAQPTRVAAARSPVISVQNTRVGRAIPSGFLGLGLEYKAIPAYAGTGPGPVNPVLVNLIRNLDPGQAASLRIGGDSTDWTWWPVKGMRQPAGVTYSLTNSWLTSAAGLARAVNARMILGINLEANSSRVAGVEARALIHGIGSHYVTALELGNEPELYGALAWNHTSAGRAILGRKPGYDFQDFTNDFSRVSKALPAITLAAPATGNDSWLADVPALLRSQPRLRMVTLHRYALNRCDYHRDAASYPSVPHLLAPVASRGLMDGTTPYVGVAHHYGASFRVAELNSTTCGGVWGVSNTFASALWALDTMFAIARTGADGVNIQTSPFPGTPNQLFTFRDHAGQWSGAVRPEYYGLLAFAQAAPRGARFLRVTTSGATPIRSWATISRSGQVHVVLINATLRRGGSVLVRVSGHGAQASVARLQAASAYATGGVTLGGQSFAPNSTTGRLAGPETTTSLRASGGGYEIAVPASSAAVLTIP